MPTKAKKDETKDEAKEPAKKKAPVKKAEPKEKKEKLPATKKKSEASDEEGLKAEKEAAKIEALEAADLVASKAAKGGSFIPAIGRRKTSVARIRLIKNGKGTITVNGKLYSEYFGTYDLRDEIISPLKVTGQETAVDVSARVLGGGIRGQAEAVRHGISRALIQLNPTFRKTLKKLGYLMRDPRKKERKKFGLKGARRSPQWSKR